MSRRPEIIVPPCKGGQYQVWTPQSGSNPRSCNVYVIELDEAEVCKRRCLGLSTEVLAISSTLVLRYWIVDKRVYYGKTEKSSGRKALLRAHELIAKLQSGQDIKPDFERRAREIVGVGDQANTNTSHEHD